MLLAIPNFIMNLWFECLRRNVDIRNSKDIVQNTAYCTWEIVFCGETLILEVQKIYYRTLPIVHKKSYEDLLLMNDDISIHQNHLHFQAREIFKSVSSLILQFTWNCFSFKPILCELRKGTVFFCSGFDLTRY